MCFCCLSKIPCQNPCPGLHCSVQQAFTISQTVAAAAAEDKEEWKPIQNSPHPHFSDTHLQSYSLSILEDPILQIHNHRPVIFPPINHEGLHVSSDDRDGCNYVEGNQEEFQISPTKAVTHILANWSYLFQHWRDKLACIVGSLSRFTIFRSLNWSSGSGVLLVGLFCAMVQWRRRKRLLNNETMSRSHLSRMIKERDEKINQLLHQIAQMNQLLLTLHKDKLSKGG